jgi:hypothetical protein
LENNCNINANPSSNSSVCLGNKLVFNTNPGYNYFMDRASLHNTYNPFIENVTATNQGL